MPAKSTSIHTYKFSNPVALVIPTSFPSYTDCKRSLIRWTGFDPLQFASGTIFTTGRGEFPQPFSAVDLQRIWRGSALGQLGVGRAAQVVLRS